MGESYYRSERTKKLSGEVLARSKECKTENFSIFLWNDKFLPPSGKILRISQEKHWNFLDLSVSIFDHRETRTPNLFHSGQAAATPYGSRIRLLILMYTSEGQGSYFRIHCNICKPVASKSCSFKGYSHMARVRIFYDNHARTIFPMPLSYMIAHPGICNVVSSAQFLLTIRSRTPL